MLVEHLPSRAFGHGPVAGNYRTSTIHLRYGDFGVRGLVEELLLLLLPLVASETDVPRRFQ